MVVPIERVRLSKPKQYVGNNLTLNINENESTIMLTGNNCKVTLGENHGDVLIVGNNCELIVLKGSGNIKYVGNCGKIVLGSGVSSKNVDYIGNEGNVTSVSDFTENTSAKVNKKTNKFINIGNVKTVRINSETRGKSTFKPLNIKNVNMVSVTSALHVPENFEIPLPMVRGRTKK
ncbi:uncharacterized protein LOC130892761 [Diorhabda carinulata]|uniref:uncharacterized protein LOC130892761 n=1 Tax=Diorhabda carinulata TaxID=1163345 RepID=UPI0025A2B096|nr:uncharacterized protein LOC130892761 [Diorhabda carinulata]